MKNPCRFALSLLLPLTAIQLHATTTGFVFCDSNQNGQFDNGDTPMPGVLVVVTNTSGTFSNANWTASPDGAFVIAVGSPTDTYVEYIHPATLPADATVIQPAGGIYTFTLGPSNTEFSGNFLVSSSTCTNGAPPPPPPATNGMTCCLHGNGSICGPNHRPTFIFGGSAMPSCGSTNGDSGEWEIVAPCQRLRFEGSVFEIVNCGEDQDASSNTFKFIEFQGAGTLKGYGGCHANHGVVYFFAHAEDHGHCKTADELYFHVYAADGTTLLLIGGDDNNPTNVVPVPISIGNLTIGTNCCESSQGGTGEGGEGDHHGHGNGGKGGCDCGPGNGHHGRDDQGAGDDKGKGNGNDHGKGNGGGDCNKGGGNGHHGGDDTGKGKGNDHGKGNGGGDCNKGGGNGHDHQGSGGNGGDHNGGNKGGGSNQGGSCDKGGPGSGKSGHGNSDHGHGG